MGISKEGYASIREVLFSSWKVILVEFFIIAFWVCMLLSLCGVLTVSPIVVIWRGGVGIVLLSIGLSGAEFVLEKFFNK